MYKIASISPLFAIISVAVIRTENDDVLMITY